MIGNQFLEVPINEWKHIVLFISHDETLIERTANMISIVKNLLYKIDVVLTAHLNYTN